MPILAAASLCTADIPTHPIRPSTSLTAPDAPHVPVDLSGMHRDAAFALIEELLVEIDHLLATALAPVRTETESAVSQSPNLRSSAEKRYHSGSGKGTTNAVEFDRSYNIINIDVISMYSTGLWIAYLSPNRSTDANGAPLSRNGALASDASSELGLGTSKRRRRALTGSSHYIDWPWSEKPGRNMFFWIVGPPASLIVIAVGLVFLTTFRAGRRVQLQDR